MNDKTTNAIIEAGIDGLENITECEGAELHQHLYNEDYFVVGYYQAEKYLAEFDTFTAIHLVQEYEQDNFGEVTTDLGDSERVCNMLAYIIGERVLGNCPTVSKYWDKNLTPGAIAKIKKELESQY